MRHTPARAEVADAAIAELHATLAVLTSLDDQALLLLARMRRGRRYRDLPSLAAHDQVQLDDLATRSPEQLLAAIAEAGPRGARACRRVPWPVRRLDSRWAEPLVQLPDVAFMRSLAGRPVAPDTWPQDVDPDVVAALQAARIVFLRGFAPPERAFPEASVRVARSRRSAVQPALVAPERRRTAGRRRHASALARPPSVSRPDLNAAQPRAQDPAMRTHRPRGDAA